MSSKSGFTKEEVEAEHARRRRARTAETHQNFKFQCIHCGCTFGPGSGGNTSVPLCDHCLHSD